MYRMLLSLAAFGLLASPAIAQAQAPGPHAHEAPAPEKKFVKKLVCQKIQEDRTTGSRLGSTSKVCRTVKVAVDDTKKIEQTAPSSER